MHNYDNYCDDYRAYDDIDNSVNGNDSVDANGDYNDTVALLTKAPRQKAGYGVTLGNHYPIHF